MTENTQADGQNAQFMIQRVYIKDASFEAPNTPATFQQEWKPELDLDIQTSHNTLDQHTYEVILNITATVKNNQSVAFLVEVKQAGIFTIQGVPSEQLDHLLGSFCPNILFPYARQHITAQVIDASFPQLVLSPINFDALYFQKQEEAKKQGQKATEKVH